MNFIKLKTVSTLLFLVISSFLFSQQSFVTCNDIHYRQYSEAISFPAEKCKIAMYTSKDYSEIPMKDTAVIGRIKKQIAERAGIDFYNQLNLKAIMRCRPSAACNFVKYTLLYYFKIDSTFNYRFMVSYDEDGNLVGEPGFPAIKERPSFYKVTNICNSLETLVSDSAFATFYRRFGMDKIKTIQLEYDPQIRNFVYKIYGVTQYHGKFGINGYAIGWWYGKIIVANAQTGEKIRVEDYKEYRSVFFK